MDKKQFVPEDFVIPSVLETEYFRLRMLSVDDVEKDYEAVMETQERFLSLGYGWPREGFTIEENLADLEQHQREFLHREAFAYTVVSPDESRVLGCVYAPRFLSIFVALSFFRFDGESALPPTAANADRWAAQSASLLVL